ncbi:MAG: hypothetical protein Ta2A_11040 [Treponemataceae bacterium]|nr:MAG: hypothetical protein Ta2A_11040 [Treponemataceae bacterium]
MLVKKDLHTLRFLDPFRAEVRHCFTFRKTANHRKQKSTAHFTFMNGNTEVTKNAINVVPVRSYVKQKYPAESILTSV